MRVTKRVQCQLTHAGQEEWRGISSCEMSSLEHGDDLELLLSEVTDELQLRVPDTDGRLSGGATQRPLGLATPLATSTRDSAQTVMSCTPSLSHVLLLSSPSAPASCGLVSVSRPAKAGDVEEHGDGASPAYKRSRAEVAVELRTKIAVSQCTPWFDRLDKVVAEFPFCPLRTLGSALRHGASSADVSRCTIGVVVSKSEPRLPSGGGGVAPSSSRTSGAYGLLRLWDMQGQQGVGNERTAGSCAVLVAESAYRKHYKRITVGSVLCLVRVQLMPPTPSSSRSSAAATCPAATTGKSSPFSEGSGGDFMLRCTESSDLRLLGFAANLAPCAALSKASGERCRILVNVGDVRYCAAHVADLRKDLLSANRTNKPAAVPSSLAGMLAPTARITTSSVGHDTSTAHATAASLRAAAAKAETFVAVRRPAPTAGGGVARSVVVGSGGLVAQQRRDDNGFGAVATAGGAYAGVVRAPLAVTGVDRTVLAGRAAGPRHGATEISAANVTASARPQVAPTTRVLPQPAKLTLAEQRISTRGRDVLAAAVRQSDAEERAAALRQLDAILLSRGEGATLAVVVGGNIMGGVPKRPRPMDSVSDTPRVGTVEKYFAPLAGESRFMEEVAPGALSRRAGISAAPTGRVAQFAAEVLRRQSASRPTVVGEHQSSKGSSASAIVTAAQSVTSRNDELREVAEREALNVSAERLLKIDKALSALEKVTVQQVSAFYCAECRRWSYVKPDDCVRNGHSLESRSVLRRFLQCHHCEHRVSVLGDTNPQLLVPRCPRCKRTALWDTSNAAPANFSVKVARDEPAENDPEERPSRSE